MSVDEMHVVADHLIHFSDKFKKHKTGSVISVGC